MVWHFVIGISSLKMYNLTIQIMIDIVLLKENPELAKSVKIETSLADLMAFGESIHRTATEAAKSKTSNNDEEYFTPQQLAALLQVSLVTLWSWDNKGILSPLRIGNTKRYRKSDIEKILSNRP
jgi:hypothetical protein